MPTLQECEAALLALALEKPVAKRESFLDAVCEGDPAMRQRLADSLTAHRPRDESMDATVAVAVTGANGPRRPQVSDTQIDQAIGQAIGRYKLLERLGEGGCGVVYVAEQTEPVRRRVALKVIKLGMDTRAVVARFEAERQALAMMDHPNISKVFDAGATDQGRPYFVMELVRGIKITDYCDQANLPTEQRIGLFIKVCQAIQHAHQKGIIHRDIKPSNILVTLHDGVPVPKVIDFGIAKATEGRLTDATVYTQLHQFIGTPAYMSPEQAEMSGLDIDTRSDIYSLGVVLYELLTGKTPFDATELMASGFDAMRKTIREQEPLRPSTKLATLQGEELTTTAKRRSVETNKLAGLLRGDLDWIVMKCLEKDRTRRYETANGLARDLTRHLNDEPIVARPATRWYLFQKIVRRNKVAFAASAAVALALLLGTAISIWEALRAKRAQALALQTRGDAEELSNFILEDFYTELEPTGRFETVARLARQAVAYYDHLPPSMRNADTDRNRAIAQARLALVAARRGESKTAMPIAAAAAAKLEEVRRQGDQSEGTLFGLGLALFAEAWSYRVQYDYRSMIVPLQRGVAALKPSATSTDGARRLKFEYADFLNMLSHLQPGAQGVAMCEEALRVLAELGALDLSDLSAASAWADIADSEAREALAIGRIEESERLEKRMQSLAEGVLAQRPGDLRARLDLTFAPDVLGVIETRRFHDAAALQLTTKAEQAAEDYVRFNPSDETGWAMLGRRSFRYAGLLFQAGRVNEALQKARATAAIDHDPRNHTGIGSITSGIWSGVARWEAQQGDRSAAEQALQEGQRALEAYARKNRMPVLPRDFESERLRDAERQVRLAFGEDATVASMAREALPRIEKLRASVSEADFRIIGDRLLVLQRQALDEAARAALKLGHHEDAETAAHALLSISSDQEEPPDLFDADEPDHIFWGRVLLAQAAIGQNRRAEALKTLQPVLAHYHDAQAQGATHLAFRQHFARALYVQALAEPADHDGNARRGDELDQAARLLQGLPDEARQLHDSKELLSWIATSRANPNPQPVQEKP
jgi:serine/threonine protein kinase